MYINRIPVKLDRNAFQSQYGSRVPARRKGRKSGMLRPDSAGFRPEQTGIRSKVPAPQQTGRKTEMCNLAAVAPATFPAIVVVVKVIAIVIVADLPPLIC